MKKVILLLFFCFLLISCKKDKPLENTKSFNIAKNAVGIVEDINKTSITINSNGESLSFNIENIDFTNAEIGDEISIIYNEDKVVSIIMQKKLIKDKEVVHLDTVIEDGTNYEYIVVNNGLKLLINDVQIEFEGSLVSGMKVSLDYIKEKNENYDGILTNLKILE